jgi:GH35 family endo-1,4-beta-xylanase
MNIRGELILVAALALFGCGTGGAAQEGTGGTKTVSGITEIDIGVADDNQQLKIMKDIVEPLWKNENVKGWTYWGYISGSTWRSNTGLMSSSGTKRPALT